MAHRPRPQHTPKPPTAAAAIRQIARRRPPLPHIARGYLCGPCQVTWAGDEADCWNCGRPATAEYARHTTAAATLLTATRTQPGSGARYVKGVAL